MLQYPLCKPFALPNIDIWMISIGQAHTSPIALSCADMLYPNSSITGRSNPKTIRSRSNILPHMTRPSTRVPTSPHVLEKTIPSMFDISSRTQQDSGLVHTILDTRLHPINIIELRLLQRRFPFAPLLGATTSHLNIPIRPSLPLPLLHVPTQSLLN